MPKLWNETIETHRVAVRDAALDAAAALIAEHGLLAVTMSGVAEGAGIGRATLYKYFPDVEAILAAWHARQIATHLSGLVEVRDRAIDAEGRLEAVLRTYAVVSHETRGHHDAALEGFFHHDRELADPRRQLHELIRDVIADAAQAGTVRGDVAPEELANYCLHALDAASSLPSNSAVQRLISVVLTGLRPDATAATVAADEGAAAEEHHSHRQHHH
ncbi:MAG: TetR/AcrR family transcriptional regulator [Leifsonia sp.]